MLLVAAILLGVPAAAWFAQDHLIFFPQPVVSTAHLPAAAKPIEIVAADGTRLRGWMRAASATPSPVVLYFGGNAEEVSWTLADPRWPSDWAIVAINYRGYGTSEGKPGETELVADALVIYDTLLRFLVQAVQLARSTPYIGGLMIWNLNYQVVVPQTDEKWGFSGLRSDWSGRPAYFALTSMAKP